MQALDDLNSLVSIRNHLSNLTANRHIAAGDTLKEMNKVISKIDKAIIDMSISLFEDDSVLTNLESSIKKVKPKKAKNAV